MKRTLKPRSAVALCFLLTAIMIGCGGPSGDGSDGSGGSSGTGGTSTIRGTITSFETAGKTFVPVEQEEEGFLTRVASWLSEALVPTAYAAGNREGIIVT